MKTIALLFLRNLPFALYTACLIFTLKSFHFKLSEVTSEFWKGVIGAFCVGIILDMCRAEWLYRKERKKVS